MNKFGFVLLFFCLVVLGGCAKEWKLLRSVDPYLKPHQQPKDPYASKVRVTGGATISLRRFYVTDVLGCAVLKVDNSQGQAGFFVNPHKAQFVNGKLGLWAMKSTVTAREVEFRKMVQDYHKVSPGNVSRWANYYFPMGTVSAGKTQEGFVCFRFGKSEKDPERVILEKRTRIRFTGAMFAGGDVRMGWLWLERLQ